MTFGSPIFRMVAAGAGLTACLLGAVQAWSAPYAIRLLAASPGKAGVALGWTSAVTAGTSVLIGGFVAALWKRHDRRAPIWIVLIGLLAPLPAFVVMLQAKSFDVFVSAYGVFMLLAMLWASPIAALVQDIVLPRMRGTAASTFALVAILVGSGLGPYWAGKISTMTGSLAVGLYSVLALVPPAALFLLVAARRLRDETDEQRYRRARDAGEPI